MLISPRAVVIIWAFLSTAAATTAFTLCNGYYPLTEHSHPLHVVASRVQHTDHQRNSKKFDHHHDEQHKELGLVALPMINELAYQKCEKVVWHHEGTWKLSFLLDEEGKKKTIVAEHEFDFDHRFGDRVNADVDDDQVLVVYRKHVDSDAASLIEHGFDRRDAKTRHKSLSSTSRSSSKHGERSGSSELHRQNVKKPELLVFDTSVGQQLPVKIYSQQHGKTERLELNSEYYLQNSRASYRFTLHTDEDKSDDPAPTEDLVLDLDADPEKNSLYVLMLTGSIDDLSAGLVLHQVQQGMTIAADFREGGGHRTHGGSSKQDEETNSEFGYKRGKWDVMPMGFCVCFLCCVTVVYGYSKIAQDMDDWSDEEEWSYYNSGRTFSPLDVI